MLERSVFALEADGSTSGEQQGMGNQMPSERHVFSPLKQLTVSHELLPTL